MYRRTLNMRMTMPVRKLGTKAQFRIALKKVAMIRLLTANIMIFFVNPLISKIKLIDK
ncbi:MAG: hypothetical protein V1880_04290 [Patescibacteria group bacterium]